MIRNQFKNIRSHPKFSRKIRARTNDYQWVCLSWPLCGKRSMNDIISIKILSWTRCMNETSKKKNQIEFVRWHTSNLDDDDDKEINTIPYYYHNAAIVICFQCMCTTIREWLQCVAGKMVLGRKIFELQKIKARKIVILIVATQIKFIQFTKLMEFNKYVGS